MIELLIFLACCAASVLAGITVAIKMGVFFTPDSYHAKPYGWLVNQISHFALGLFFSVTIMVIGYLFTGELPSRLQCFFILLCGYTAFEIVQKGAIRDTIEDIIFTIIYGCGISMYCAKWTYGSHFDSDVFNLFLCLLVPVTHLFIGVTVRKRQKLKNGSKLEN